jgi:hypothetical protein
MLDEHEPKTLHAREWSLFFAPADPDVYQVLPEPIYHIKHIIDFFNGPFNQIEFSRISLSVLFFRCEKLRCCRPDALEPNIYNLFPLLVICVKLSIIDCHFCAGIQLISDSFSGNQIQAQFRSFVFHPVPSKM